VGNKHDACQNTTMDGGGRFFQRHESTTTRWTEKEDAHCYSWTLADHHYVLTPWAMIMASHTRTKPCLGHDQDIQQMRIWTYLLSSYYLPTVCTYILPLQAERESIPSSDHEATDSHGLTAPARACARCRLCWWDDPVRTYVHTYIHTYLLTCLGTYYTSSSSTYDGLRTWTYPPCLACTPASI